MHFYIKETFVLLVISLILFSSVKSESDCEIVINEINIIDPQKPNKNEYIELKSTCNMEVSLRGYKLIGFNCQTETGTIDLIITLWNVRTNENGFFTIGGHEVSTADLKIPNDYIKFKNSFIPSIGSFTIKKNIRAIGLLYDKKQFNPFSDFVLTKKQPNIKITEEILVQLKNYLIDLVVFAENKACDKSTIFEKIKDDFVFKKYILREFPSNSKKDISLNRCAIESTLYWFSTRKIQIWKSDSRQ